MSKQSASSTTNPNKPRKPRKPRNMSVATIIPAKVSAEMTLLPASRRREMELEQQEEDAKKEAEKELKKRKAPQEEEKREEAEQEKKKPRNASLPAAGYEAEQEAPGEEAKEEEAKEEDAKEEEAKEEDAREEEAKEEDAKEEEAKEEDAKQCIPKVFMFTCRDGIQVVIGEEEMKQLLDDSIVLKDAITSDELAEDFFDRCGIISKQLNKIRRCVAAYKSQPLHMQPEEVGDLEYLENSALALGGFKSVNAYISSCINAYANSTYGYPDNIISIPGRLGNPAEYDWEVGYLLSRCLLVLLACCICRSYHTVTGLCAGGGAFSLWRSKCKGLS